MFSRITIKVAFMLLVLNVLAVELQNSTAAPKKRQAPPTQRPGFLRTLFSVIFEQWQDTRNTIGSINNLIANNVVPDPPPTKATPPTPTPQGADPTASTTAAPFRLTRSELGKILRRNIKGLQKLYDLELRDALKQSRVTDKEFRRNATKEISKFL